MDNYNNGNQPNGGGNPNGNGNGNDNNGGGRNNRGGQALMAYIIVSLVVLLIMSLMMNRFTEMTTEEITYTQFLELVEDNQIESVKFDSYQINITPKNENTNPLSYESQISY